MERKGEDLSERLLDFAEKIIKLLNHLPNTVVGRYIKGQLIKSGTSPGANYEEACGAESRADFVHRLGIVLKELKESRFWLKLIKRAKLVRLDYINILLQVYSLPVSSRLFLDPESF